MRQIRYSLIANLLLASAVIAADESKVTLEVLVGEYDRHGTPVAFDLPPQLASHSHFELTRLDSQERVDVQKAPGSARVVWILDDVLRKGKSRRYRLAPGAAADAGKPDVRYLNDGERLSILVRDKPVLTYNIAVQQPPPGIDKLYRRSGFIYPVFDPAGRPVTDDFPPDHAHQHSLFYAWADTTFEGRRVDFWNQHKRTGDVGHVALKSAATGGVFAQFAATLSHYNTTAPGGDK